MTTMWKVAYGSPTPAEVEAEVPTWPNRDADGDQIFTNTHFLKTEDAWKQHLAEHRAGLSLGARRVSDLRAQLDNQEKELASTAIIYDAALRAYEEFKGKS